MSSWCTCPFLPRRLRLHIWWNAFRTSHAPGNAASTGEPISRLQSFAYVQAPALAQPPGCTHRELLESEGYTLDDVDWFVPHQVNELILRNAYIDQLKVPWDKVLINLDKYGNTTAGTIPIALDEAIRDGRIQRGQLVLMVVVGAGLCGAPL